MASGRQFQPRPRVWGGIGGSVSVGLCLEYGRTKYEEGDPFQQRDPATGSPPLIYLNQITYYCSPDGWIDGTYANCDWPSHVERPYPDPGGLCADDADPTVTVGEGGCVLHSFSETLEEQLFQCVVGYGEQSWLEPIGGLDGSSGSLNRPCTNVDSIPQLTF